MGMIAIIRPRVSFEIVLRKFFLEIYYAGIALRFVDVLCACALKIVLQIVNTVRTLFKQVLTYYVYISYLNLVLYAFDENCMKNFMRSFKTIGVLFSKTMHKTIKCELESALEG